MPSATEQTVDSSPVTSRRIVVAAVAAAVAGVGAGLVWLWLARPAQWEGRNGGLVLTEAASRGQFGVIVTFVLIGIVVSVACGWLVVRLVPDLGWLAVPVAVLLTAVMSVIAWRVGVALGPPDPSTVAGVQDGDRVPSRLAIDGVAPFLVWPIFGLAGVMVATWADGRRLSERSEPRPPQ
jgi:hypothetical protein